MDSLAHHWLITRILPILLLLHRFLYIPTPIYTDICVTVYMEYTDSYIYLLPYIPMYM